MGNRLHVEHGIFWIVTQPVNKVWLKAHRLGTAGRSFFASGGAPDGEDWTALRNRWEYSHVARAVFAMLGLIALVLAAVRPA